ncbi:HK97 family phage prohead protease [Sphingomonas ginkgonis]|uniref:HK97 family phage prohead protease n=1 Tax=Sphingomonas ginkgonis TaxID=2315330 RepID=A0A429V859_9SPHN|nr:HK97 family phage prohead protease [Sphingomonas ginkgonis]RST30150.1 HK97 family phage prohead protease [Sphingomonas ginkgonis]
MTAPAKQPEGREQRAVSTSLELRAAAAQGEGRTATGYACLFGNKTAIGSYWTEEIRQGAFSKSLAENDVIAVVAHDTGRVVGRTGAGTLSLREDAKGLAFENQLPDTTDGRDLVVLLERQDIPGMSFGFITRKQEWDETVDPPHRTIIEADLYEITYTPCPAYPDTEVGLRDLEHARTERRQHNRAGAEARMAARRARQAQAERQL